MSELEILNRAQAAIEVFKPYMDGWGQMQGIAFAKKCAEIMLRSEQMAYLNEQNAIWTDAKGNTRSYPAEQRKRLAQKAYTIEVIIKKINEL